ncbi:tetratricopeptide repeat protein [Sorangium sp. So ce131]|uniref:tetratricopeptide repeat protein n=1 Tax=Sorangium sp. So ce131 TaxID=3133282 RepID=UPI003F5E3EA0
MINDIASALSAIFTGERARLLHVIIPAHVHGHTLALLRALGEAGPSPRPVWVLADPTYGPSRGWAARARSLARELGAPPGAADPPGQTPLAGPPGEPLSAFAAVLSDHLAACGPDASAVLVLSPQHIDDPPAYARDLLSLAQRPELSPVRWVVVDPVHSSVGDLLARVGEGTSRVVWPEADSAAIADIERLLTDLSARGRRLPADLEARIAPGSPLRAPDLLPARRLLHEADRCFQAGRHAEAAQLQQQAEGLLSGRGLGEEAVHVAMQRARSLIAAGTVEEGHRVFVAALKEAERRGLLAIIPEAYASLGSLHSKHRRFQDAAEAYSRAGELADRRGSREFAADMHRCAGHAALNADMPDAAAQSWRRAFELLGAMAPAVGALEKPQQIVILGLALADVFESHGNLPAARGLRGHAEAIETRNPRRSETWS